MPLVRSSAPKEPPKQLSLAQLERALLEGDEKERWAAARAAGESPDALSLLAAAMSRESEDRVREAIFTSLARIRTPESRDVILPYLRSDNSSLRTAALDALRAMPDTVAAKIPALLQDEDADVRVLACELVRGRTPNEAAALLTSVLETEQVPNVCSSAIDVLAETGGPELLPLFTRCAARFPDDPFLAFAVQIAGERLGSQR